MVLGTTAKEIHSVHIKGYRNPDFLRSYLDGCDVPTPAGAGNDGGGGYGVYLCCRDACLGLFKRQAICPMGL